VEPYKQVANQLLAIVNKQAYERKEKFVNALASLLSSRTSKRTVYATDLFTLWRFSATGSEGISVPTVECPSN